MFCFQKCSRRNLNHYLYLSLDSDVDLTVNKSSMCKENWYDTGGYDHGHIVNPADKKNPWVVSALCSNVSSPTVLTLWISFLRVMYAQQSQQQFDNCVNLSLSLFSLFSLSLSLSLSLFLTTLSPLTTAGDWLSSCSSSSYHKTTIIM